MAVKENRVRRTPINGTRNRLTVRGQEPGFVYRIVNDIDDRIQTFQEMGYEVVTEKNVSVGDKRIANPTQEGTPVTVSVGQGITGFLMRQKQEWYDEDQAAKNRKTDELEASMHKEKTEENFYGKLKISRE